MKKDKLVVEQIPEAPVEKKVLAQAIMDISKAFKDLQKSGLNRKAIIILIAHKSRIYQSNVERVLDCLEALQADYTK